MFSEGYSVQKQCLDDSTIYINLARGRYLAKRSMLVNDRILASNRSMYSAELEVEFTMDGHTPILVAL